MPKIKEDNICEVKGCNKKGTYNPFNEMTLCYDHSLLIKNANKRR